MRQDPPADRSPSPHPVPSHGVLLGADRWRAGNDDLLGPGGRPCVVMAHGFGCTRDGGLAAYAAAFAAAGCDVLVFDYRGFGTSGGTPRQDVDHRRHREDYTAAVAEARRLDGVDPERIVLWGTSYSGGHVLAVAADDPRVAAVVSQGAAVDGRAILLGTGRGSSSRDDEGGAPGSASSARRAARIASAVARDLLASVTGRRPVHLAVFGNPGEAALMTAPGGARALAPILGPTFRNELCARGLLRIPRNRPVTVAAQVRCPALLVIAERDEIAPPSSVREAARAMARSEVAAYDCSHFALYADAPGSVFGDVLERQLAFLGSRLALGV
ncbi:alpha/beta hydrolase [Nocardioidaceae bacterium]|nr:alpha/beta hydrolase [Nocardioidaceae bacterium]